MMTPIIKFLKSPAFAVIGASSNRKKFGNKVLRCYLQHQMRVFPVNPHETTIENLACISSITALPIEVESISIVTPPNITQIIVQNAAAHGIKNIWLQPGSENEQIIDYCYKNKINIIAKGPCLLVELGFLDL